MNTEFSAARVYTDLNGLAELRAAARDKSPEAAKAVAQQFESLLVQMMLKSMRAVSFGKALLDSDAGRLYRDLFDRQVALALSERGQLGFADLIQASIAGAAQWAASVPAGRVAAEAKAAAARMEPPARPTPQPHDLEERAPEPGAMPRPHGPDRLGRSLPAAEEIVPPSPAIEATPEPPTEFTSPHEFMRELRPAASRAGAELGVDPELLIAQAALETGWGRAIMRDGLGRSSHNLFGIKADGRWAGPRVTKSTLEFKDGIAVRERAQFRSYDSFAASFDDYVSFLRSQPRYRDALKQVSDPGAYMHALQSAGYATDPKYAAKVLDIYSRRIGPSSGDPIKLARAVPL